MNSIEGVKAWMIKDDYEICEELIVEFRVLSKAYYDEREKGLSGWKISDGEGNPIIVKGLRLYEVTTFKLLIGCNLLKWAKVVIVWSKISNIFGCHNSKTKKAQVEEKWEATKNEVEMTSIYKLLFNKLKR